MAEWVNEGAAMKGESGEEEQRLLEGVAMVDFDVLCSTVALQTQGKWMKLDGGGEYGGDGGGLGGGEFGGVLRMWEGELLDCFEDGRIAAQSACCPCYRFGKNMGRAGFGSCFIQGFVYLILAVTAVFNFVAFVVTGKSCFFYLGTAVTISIGIYLGFYRTQIRNKFNIGGTDNSLDDCVYHLVCPCCTLCQESRTLEMNNVQDGTWHGPGDTLCIGGYGESSKAFFELRPPSIASIKSYEAFNERASKKLEDRSWELTIGPEAAQSPYQILKSITEKVMTISERSEAPARLKGKHSAMAICWILGLGSLVSWNSMLTIEDYYYALFPAYHPARVLTLVYQPFALGTMAILAYYESKIDTRRRNLTGYILFFISCLALLVLDFATSGKGGIGNFIGICVLMAAFGVADAHVQGGMTGDLSFMCPELIQSFLAGLAASGALTSALRLITKAAFENYDNGLRKGAMLFLGLSTFIEFVCIFLYAYVFPKLPIVKFYRSKAASEGSTTVSADLAVSGTQTWESEGLLMSMQNEGGPETRMRLSNKELFLQNIDYALGLFLILSLTLSIFPGFLYENTGSSQSNPWYPLILVATFNVCDLISRCIPLVKILKMKSRKWLMVATLSRLLLIPAFYFAAKYGGQVLMMSLTSFLGLTNGYLMVCIFTEAPKGYKGPEQYALGNLLVLCLLGGIFAGAALDWLWLIGSNEKF